MTRSESPGALLAAPIRRHLPTVLVVSGIHALALVLLIAGRAAGAVPVALAAFAYSRGLIHALDADHLCMIDGSTRKLLGEGRAPEGVGLAFSLGHSTVVLLAGLAVASGATWIRDLVGAESGAARVLGLIGAGVSAAYLLAVAAANVPNLGHHHAGRGPMGPWARLLSKPLSRVRHVGHIYLFGILFGLGFDTASTIALLMMTALATMSGSSPLVLMALPVAFTAAMSLGDSVNANLMLYVYTSAQQATRARFNMIVTSISILCALVVASSTLVEIVAELTGRPISGPDTTPIAWGLLALALGGCAFALARRSAHRVRMP
ncbi:hypothetical protein [Schaalia hyovaginalis]|uniref:HoxN/HupN/NixA family nickel/cobalt transporter n=1 Tax=Schaalia hyovaginalis TaxID=29316 RepID=UPI0026EAB9DB|nr:hypothetical protein [Schaalia hyovaginalis]MCI7512639.1 hypothetical protein [Schaalia hyovaginalis]